MNEKINADLKSIKFIFERNKPYMVPVIVILICVILFFQFIIPQFKVLALAREQAEEASLKLETLKKNLNVLMNISEKSLDSQLEIMNKALPLNKDFSGILNSIYFAAQKTGVNLGAFSLQIGDLSEAKNKDKFPKISISIPINSGGTSVNSFVQTINKTVPLSEVTRIKIGEKDSRIKNSILNVSFYYKHLGSSGSNQDAQINPISQKGLLLIQELSGFENVSPIFDNVLVATSSSEKKSSPF